jgi:hypothetical protein
MAAKRKKRIEDEEMAQELFLDSDFDTHISDKLLSHENDSY